MSQPHSGPASLEQGGQRLALRPAAGSGAQRLVLHLPAELRSVSTARAELSVAARRWGCAEGVVEDARVALSELMSNGVLHARTELEVVVSLCQDGGLRIEVHDMSSVPVLPPLGAVAKPVSLHDRPEAPGLDSVGAVRASATGRGLAMVAALASSWGWSPEPGGGKTVWAEVGVPAPTGAPGEGIFAERSVHPVRPVRLVALPLRLLKESEDHLDDLFRELQMANMAAPQLRPGEMVGATAELSLIADTVKGRLARLREPVRRGIWEALRRGDRLVDLNLLADAGMPEVFESSDDFLRRAARAARDGLLLTEEPDREVVAWRRWLRREMEGQIAGQPPRACPFPVWAVEAGGAGADRGGVGQGHREALGRLKALFAAALGPSRAGAGTGGVAAPPGGGPRRGGAGAAWTGHELATLRGSLDLVVSSLSARRGVLMTLAEDNETVDFGPSVGFSPPVMSYWRASSLSADLPASEAIRTSKALLFRTFAELDERYPIFLSAPSESDPAVACVPVPGGNAGSAGCLVVGFSQARDFPAGEVAYLGQVAAEIGRYLAAVEARRRRAIGASRMEALERVSARLSQAAEVGDVVEQLLAYAVGFLVDAAALYLVDASGVPHYVKARHRDRGRLAAAEELLSRQRAATDANSLVNECARSGRVTVLQTIPVDAVAAGTRDDEDYGLVRKLAIGSVGVLPARAGGRVVAVLSLAKDVGHFITEEDLEVARRLADDAGEAIYRTGPITR